MANQMIALQARIPQAPNLGAIAAQYGNAMANMAAMKEKQASTQRANAFRQLVSDPNFDPSNPEHVKAAQSLDPAGAEKIVSAADARRKSNLEYLGQLTEHYRNQLANVDPNDKVTYGALREEIVRAIPGWGSRLPTIEQWNADTRLRTLFQADKVIEKTVATPVASFQVSDKGVPQSVTVGGLQPSVKEVPQFRYEEEPQPAANAAPTPPKLRQPTPVAPEALDAAAAAIAEGKYMDDPRLKGLPPEALDEAQKRAMRLRLDTMPPVEGSMQPMSARQGQPDLAQVVNDMMATGFVTQSNLEAMRQVAGPDKDAQLAEILRSNNIQIVPDEGADQFRSAVYRPEQGVGMQEVGYVPTTTRFKPATQGTVPGEYSLPTSEIQRRERAKRETPAEAAAKAAAVKQAEIREEQLKAKSDQKRAAENFFKVIGVNPRSKDDPVARLIKQSTSGALEAIGAELVGAIPSEFGGGATEGAKAIGELETIAAKLTNDLLGGKLGTGISNEDRKMIERMVGTIQDPFIPAEKRLAAWNRVKQIQAAYLGNAATNKPSTGRVVRTGTVNGRRVVQYSDGRIEYAD